ncbi:hypothetical protein K1T71_000652 [Dendrolimus kikuchii]|uniref:Uncharacterized protein n=1 Tax=Dendrolimus kikuchii TaxID=765133 RepID=A0ACC1DJT0_9NEOP|nr:hypothetical protein K1T71_000652 [Dendrolimus kikuchii]
MDRDEGPVYYREIQKNAYLKRIPNEIGGNKLMPLGHKKPPLKPMWTQLCVHNGRTPYLEQYPEPEHPCALGHRPVWRACLLAARHVTASVRPTNKQEYDFLVDTDNGPVRMLAPDWETMQDWVTTLRNKLAELKIVGKGENVYCSPPAAPLPRAAARDPTSPLPPTPPVPPDRVPGIELIPATRQPIEQQQPAIRQTEPSPPSAMETQPSPPEPEPPAAATIEPIQENIDISNWDTSFTSLPSTSTTKSADKTKKVAKICGQNICLDDSIFKRTSDGTDSEDEFFEDIDSLHDSMSNLDFNSDVHKQRVVVNDDKADCGAGDRPTNITVIQVSNKEVPHTAIPVLGPETDVFDFEFKPPSTPKFINIVNTEVNVQNSDYGTVFSKTDSDYGHLSLTTTVSLPGRTNVNLTDVSVTAVNPNKTSNGSIRAVNTSITPLRQTNSIPITSIDSNSGPISLPSINPTPVTVTDVNMAPVSLTDVNVTAVSLTDASQGVYERLCMASTSTDRPSPLPKRLKHFEKSRKSSLPNLDVNESAYEYLFLSRDTQNNNDYTQNNSTQNNSAQNQPTHNQRSIIERRKDRSNVERSQSQNAYDIGPRRERVQNSSPKREAKNEKPEMSKPIWKRGLTELSLLTKLKGIGKRQESPSRNENDTNDRNNLSSPIKVVHRSRTEARVDSSRRRSSSLNNGQSPPTSGPRPSLQPLLARQAAALRAEQRRGAALVASVHTAKPPIFADYNKQVWIASWNMPGSRWCGRCGDRLVGIHGVTPLNAQHAKQMIMTTRAYSMDALFHRVPLAKVYVVNRRDKEGLGIKLDNECNIVNVELDSPAHRAGIPPPGKWAVTEVNNRSINLIKGGEEEMNRISAHGTEVLILIQPSPLVKKLRAALKGSKNILGLR